MFKKGRDRGPCYVGFGRYNHSMKVLELKRGFKVIGETQHGEYGGEVTIFKCAVCGMVEETIMFPQWRLKDKKAVD